VSLLRPNLTFHWGGLDDVEKYIKKKKYGYDGNKLDT
jgi:hypothetical protein